MVLLVFETEKELFKGSPFLPGVESSLRDQELVVLKYIGVETLQLKTCGLTL